MKTATCHPELKHHAKGLCKKCYHDSIRNTPEQKLKSNKRAKDWAKANSERVKELDTRKNLKKKYGISLEQYNFMLLEQEGVCKLCKKPEKVKDYQKLAVDHCHITGRVRGLLCFKCNTSIAQIENENLLDTLKSYLGQ